MSVSLREENKMAVRPVFPLLMSMAIPPMISMLIQSLYNIVDSMFVAKIGEDALTAVSLAFPVQTLIVACSVGIGVGVNSYIPRSLGREDQEGADSAVAHGLLMAAFVAVLFIIAGQFLLEPFFRLFSDDPAILADAITYTNICLTFCAGSFIHICIEKVFQSTGSMIFPMLLQALGAITNIILDPILISGLGMGALGAAVATVIGYLCSVMYFLLVLRKKSHCLSVKLSQCHVRADELRQILGVGITAALSNLMQSLTVIVINQFLLAYGNDKIAAMGIVLKVNMIAQLILTGFAFGGVPMYGYLYGAKQQDTLKKLLRFCLLFLCGLSLALTAFLCLAATPLMRLFVQDSALVATGAEMLRWQAATAVFAGIVLLLTVLFQATGKIVPAFLLSISRQGIVFIVMLVVCVRLFAYNGVIMAQAVADVLSAILALGLLIGYNPLKQ